MTLTLNCYTASIEMHSWAVKILFLSALERISMVIDGDFRAWGDRNIEILCEVKPILTHGNQETLELFKKCALQI